jgi:hypothetical protein
MNHINIDMYVVDTQTNSVVQLLLLLIHNLYKSLNG